MGCAIYGDELRLGLCVSIRVAICVWNWDKQVENKTKVLIQRYIEKKTNIREKKNNYNIVEDN